MANPSKEKDKEAEFITQWNGLLDYKIDEQNLRRPDFQFFYNALESLLRSLNFDIDSAKNEVINSEAERLYFIKFCGFVHRLYQLSDASFNFYYFDLLSPTPKKSFHVLKMLFNYLKYYEMVKQTICEKASDVLGSYNDALSANNALQIKNETAKKRAANMELQLSEYGKRLPAIQERINKCLTDVHTLDEEITQKNADIKNFDSTIIKVEIKQTELGETIVSDEEYNNRVDTIVALERELMELREVAEHVRSSNVGSSAKIHELTRINEIICKILEEQNMSDYDDLMSIDLNLDSTNNEIKREEQQVMELTTKIQALTEKMETIISKTKQVEANTETVKVNSDAFNEELIWKKSYHEKNIEVANGLLTNARSHIEELNQQQHLILSSVLLMLQTLISPSNQLYKTII